MDHAIQSTSDDATRAKVAAVRAGYYDDPFVTALAGSSASSSSSSSTAPFAPPASPACGHRGQQQHQHRPRLVQPIIKRGTHARVACVDRAVTSFLRTVLNPPDGRRRHTSCQIVVLGSGKDTSYFRLRARIMHGLEGDDDAGGGGRLRSMLAAASLRWYDVDHPAVIREKAAAIDRERSVFRCTAVRRSEICFECASPSPPPANAAGSGDERCFLVSYDLRGDVLPLRDELLKHGFDRSVPTLFVSECFLMYLPEDASASLLRGIVAMVEPSTAYLAMYEPVLGDDAFGRVMETNLVKAGVAEPGSSCLLRTRSLSQHLSKLHGAGFDLATGCDMWSAYETVVTPEQRQRANRCEFLDELEEWILIMKHYCLVVASNDVGDGSHTVADPGSGRESRGAVFCSVGAASPMGFATGRCESIS